MILEVLTLIALSVLTAVVFSALLVAAIMAIIAFGEYVANKVSGWFRLLKIWYRERHGKVRSAVIVIQGRGEGKLRYKLEVDDKVYNESDVSEFKELLDKAENRNSFIEVDGQKVPAFHLDKEAEEQALNQNRNNNF